MSKRKNRKQRSRPNLPEETLARARRQAGLEVEDDTPEAEAAEETEAAPVAEANAEPEAPAASSTLPPIERRSSRSSRRRRGQDPEEMSQAEIAERLAHPTRRVSVEELRAQYAYVLADLRSMGILAALLFVAMIVAAQFL